MKNIIRNANKGRPRNLGFCSLFLINRYIRKEFKRDIGTETWFNPGFRIKNAIMEEITSQKIITIRREFELFRAILRGFSVFVFPNEI